MTNQRCGFVYLMTLVLAVSYGVASEIPGPSLKDQLSLRSLQSPRISPDGTQVVFRVRSTDWEKNRYDYELWLAGRDLQPYPLTRTADGSTGNAQWSPDGSWIAFTADRGDKNQIYLIRAAGGEARPVTAEKDGVSGYLWSPDGKSIAFIQTEAEDSEDKKRVEEYGSYAVEDKEYRQQHLWLVDVGELLQPEPGRGLCFSHAENEAHEDASDDDSDKGEGEDDEDEKNDCRPLPQPRRLTDGDFTVRSPSWSPDGKWIAFEQREHPDILSFQTADIALLEVATGEIKALVSEPGYDGGPTWSPDSKWISYSSSQGNTTSNFYRNGAVLRISVDGGPAQRLAADFDENISVTDWNPQGIYFTAWQRMQRRLFHLDPETGRTRLVSESPELIWSVSFSKDGSQLAFTSEQPGGIDELYVSSARVWQPRAVTRMSDQVAGWTLGTREVVRWKSRDGTEIEGVLYKPADFDASRKYPLFVVIHGGPTGIDYPTAVPGTVYPILQWLAKGAVVLRPNYRGSAGYGEAFRSLNVRNLGVGDAWDVLSGVDHLEEQGFVDTDRMGAMGWSQGGYISAFLTTNTDRFKAISVGAGISNWMTYYVNTDIHPFTRQYLKATPWEDPDIYALTSPMTNIRQATTPTLIQHGEFDRRVPIPNAYELYQGLQDVGVETELIVYKGFGHGISKPKERLAAMQHNWDWFARYVWQETAQLVP